MNQRHTQKLVTLTAVNTVWKFQNFSVTQILREINFEHSRSAKSDSLTHLQSAHVKMESMILFQF